MSTESATSSPPADEPPAEFPPGEFQERIRLLDWAEAQVGTDGITPEVGDFVLATDGRILGYGPDYYDLYRRVVTDPAANSMSGWSPSSPGTAAD